MQTPNAFQTAFTLEKEEPIEKPNPEPGKGNPQVGSVAIRAMKGNAGVIFVGPKGVNKENGFELAAGDALTMDITSLGGLYGFATKANDKLCVFFVGP